MSDRYDTSWHKEAIRLHDSRMTRKQIAIVVGKSETSIRWVLGGCRKRSWTERVRNHDDIIDVRRKIDPPPEKKAPPPKKIFTGDDSSFTAQYVPKPIRKVINREAVAEATGLFAKGKISREELLARITVQNAA